MDDRKLVAFVQAFRVVHLVDLPAMLVGGFAAALGHRWGAYVLLANLLTQLGGHLTVGAAAFRHTMSRPWPQVAPLPDDEWDG